MGSTCPVCRTEEAPGTRFCRICGTPAAAACPACGAASSRDDRFCGSCGADLATAGASVPAAVAASPAPAPAPEPQEAESPMFEAMLMQVIASEGTPREVKTAVAPEGDPPAGSGGTEGPAGGIRFPFTWDQVETALKAAGSHA